MWKHDHENKKSSRQKGGEKHRESMHLAVWPLEKHK